MNKHEIALEILKLCAERIVTNEAKTQQKPDYAGRLTEAYNQIVETVKDPRDR